MEMRTTAGAILTPSRGWYFSGFFDGEGSFLIWTRTRTDVRHEGTQQCLAVSIGLRADDVSVLETFREWLGGHIGRYGGNRSSKPSAQWRLERLKELREKIVPLFDAYPLRTKKAVEFQLWREVVVQRYEATNGGTSRPMWTEEALERFSSVERAIKFARKL